MPKVKTTQHESNGRANISALHGEKKRLGDVMGIRKAFEQLRSGGDEVVIGSGLGGGDGVVGSTMADAAKVVSRIKFLVPGWVPYGQCTGVVAEPGKGKSAFILFGLVRPIVTGCRWFTGADGPSEPGKVLWLGTENDMSITLGRIEDWGIPRDRIILPFEDDPLKTVDLTNPEHIVRIENLINCHKTKMFVVDSLRGGHDGDENNSRVGRVMKDLAGIAERTGAANPIAHHTRKLGPDEEISANSTRGSNAIFAMMRSLIGIDRPDSSSKWCRLRILKENLGIAPAPIGFLFPEDGSALQFGPAPEKQIKVRETVKADATDWLRINMIAGKWYRASTLMAAAKKAKFSGATIQRARETLGIVSPKNVRTRKKDRKSEWRLSQ